MARADARRAPAPTAIVPRGTRRDRLFFRESTVDVEVSCASTRTRVPVLTADLTCLRHTLVHRDSIGAPAALASPVASAPHWGALARRRPRERTARAALAALVRGSAAESDFPGLFGAEIRRLRGVVAEAAVHDPALSRVHTLVAVGAGRHGLLPLPLDDDAAAHHPRSGKCEMDGCLSDRTHAWHSMRQEPRASPWSSCGQSALPR
jgi:hypothetical protein